MCRKWCAVRVTGDCGGENVNVERFITSIQLYVHHWSMGILIVSELNRSLHIGCQFIYMIKIVPAEDYENECHSTINLK